MERFDQLTDRARRVFTEAQREAEHRHHPYIGTEDLLLGLTQDGESTASRALTNLGVEPAKVRTALEFILGRPDRPVLGEYGLTPAVRRVIELAIDDARSMGHHYVGTEHLLLGLVREGNTIAASVLVSLGVTLEKLRREVALLAPVESPGSSGSPD